MKKTENTAHYDSSSDIITLCMRVELGRSS